MPDPGELWIADIPFVQGGGSKLRPVLVLWIDGVDRIVATVTSSPSRTPADVQLQDWQPSGLLKPSVVRLMRPSALLHSRLTRRIGVISRRDARTPNKAWAKHLKLSL
jgi:mRNA interferase MazF